MSKEQNIQLHRQVIQKARLFPVGSDKRITLIHRSIEGILRALAPNFNHIHG